MSTVFFHVDVDAFYASVEQHDDPSLAGKPVIVGAKPGHRGVVSACSYEARRFGVHSAMPISQAYRLCPSGVFLPVRMSRYQEVSRSIMAILADYTPSLHQVSVDEAFMDVSGSERLFGPPASLARTIKDRVASETGLTVSVGVAANRFLAKLASEVDKPDGLHVVASGTEEQFVASLPLTALWGVGKKTVATLNAIGIRTVVQLREYGLDELSRHMGHAGAAYLSDISRGRDPGLYTDHPATHSISGEHTFERDVRDADVIERVLLETAETCVYRLLEDGGTSRTVTVKLRLADFTTYSAQRTMDHPVDSTAELYGLSRELVMSRWDHTTPIRLVGCGFANVELGPAGVQPELFDDASARRRKVEQAVHRLKRQGLHVAKARLLRSPAPRPLDGTDLAGPSEP